MKKVDFKVRVVQLRGWFNTFRNPFTVAREKEELLNKWHADGYSLSNVNTVDGRYTIFTLHKVEEETTPQTIEEAFTRAMSSINKNIKGVTIASLSEDADTLLKRLEAAVEADPHAKQEEVIKKTTETITQGWPASKVSEVSEELKKIKELHGNSCSSNDAEPCGMHKMLSTVTTKLDEVVKMNIS